MLQCAWTWINANFRLPKVRWVKDCIVLLSRLCNFSQTPLHLKINFTRSCILIEFFGEGNKLSSSPKRKMGWNTFSTFTKYSEKVLAATVNAYMWKIEVILAQNIIKIPKQVTYLPLKNGFSQLWVMKEMDRNVNVAPHINHPSTKPQYIDQTVRPCPNVSTTTITAMGRRQCLPLSIV